MSLEKTNKNNIYSFYPLFFGIFNSLKKITSINYYKLILSVP